MARPEVLEATGVIEAELPKSRWRVKLPNGHRLIVWRGKSETGTPLVPGQKVRIKISPGDFSQGRLLK